MDDYRNFNLEQYWSIAPLPSIDPRCICYNHPLSYTPHGVSQDPMHYDCSKDKQSISFVGHSESSLKSLDENNDATTAESNHSLSSATEKVEASSAVSSNSEVQSSNGNPNSPFKLEAESRSSVSRKAVKQRKTRTLFSPGQINVLEQVFSDYHYIASSQRKLLAQKIGISEAQVRVWFQNRRIKWRKEGKEFVVKCENN